MIIKFKLSKLFRLSSRSRSKWPRLRSKERERAGAQTTNTGARSFDKEYQLLGVLGTGGFGTVHRARRLSDGAVVAVKVVAKEKVVQGAGEEQEQGEARLPLEVSLLRQVRIVCKIQ